MITGAEYAQLASRLERLLAQGDLAQVESESRAALARHRHYLWHLYLIVSLLRGARRDEAGRELDDLFSYKFNIAERAPAEVKAAFPEKFEGHYVLNTMKAEHGVEQPGVVRKPWTVPYPLVDEAAFGRAVDELIADGVPALPLLDRSATPVATFGSCFAANLARVLKASGVDASNLLIEESINSPLANEAFLAGIAGRGSAHDARLLQTYGEEFLARARGQLAGARVIVLTLGVAPAFFYADTGAFAFLEDYRTLIRQGVVRMRTPGVEETKGVIAEVLGLLRALNPAARVYVTISPVPLAGTAELPSAVLADCVSKTTLRAALHEVLQGGRLGDVHYWPSFEIVRWLGGHAQLASFGADDKVSRHVSNWLVAMIVDRFSRHLFGASPR